MPDTGPTNRQRELVRILTSGGRCSPNRAWRHAGFQNHHPSLGQMLRSPAIVELFREAVAAGKILPHEHRDRIMQAITKADLDSLR
jgi:hypothetical protein